ncbi:MAG: F0F1 ATP synthase subunit B [Saprospiraceae bacterium]|nr:F0F1 ATP synthase subunit B [Saprospiraceae bacterium]
MFFLAEFSVFSPDFGLFFWTLAIFLVFFFLLSKFAFKPIAQALKDREDSIKDALASADRAKAEMSNLKSENEALLAKAKEERALMLKEAKDNAANIVSEAKNAAKEEANKIMTNAKLEIDNMKQSALTDVKNQVGLMALDIAEKVIRKELKGSAEQVAFVNTLAKEMNLN